MSELTVGDLVWAKLKGYPAWPGKVVYPPTSLKPKKSHHYVFFFGTENYAWVPDKSIFPYAENLEKLSSKCKTSSFKKAVEAIAKFADENQASTSEEDDAPSLQSQRSNSYRPVVRQTKKRTIKILDMTDNDEVPPKRAKGLSPEESQAGPSQPTFSQSEYQNYYEPITETGTQRRERIVKRMRELNQARVKERGTGGEDDEDDESRSSEDQALEPEDPEIEEINRVSSADKDDDDLLSEPVTHIKIESDNEGLLTDSSDDDSTNREKETIILAEKPKRLGYVPDNVRFRTSIVAERKAARLAIQNRASQQSSTAESSDVVSGVPQMTHEVQELSSNQVANVSDSHIKDVAQQKERELSTNVSESHVKEVSLQTERELSTSISESHVKEVSQESSSASTSLLSCKGVRKPVVVVSRKEQDICAEKLAELAGVVKATKIPIGILGLGMLGKGIVKNLLRTGHKVNIWDCDAEKCSNFLSQGANAFDTPAAIVRSSDIVFLCLDDMDVLKSVTHSKAGIFRGFDECVGKKKGLVNMTFVCPEKSIELNEKMQMKRMRYLEVQVAEHSETMADEGTLLLICSGNRLLYKECASFFYAISGQKAPLFLSTVAKDAPTMKLLYVSFTGTLYAGLQEAISSVEGYKLNKKIFVEILKHTALDSSGIINKATELLKCGANLDVPVTYVQYGMGMAIVLANKMSQPMRALSAAHEACKMRRCLQQPPV